MAKKPTADAESVQEYAQAGKAKAPEANTSGFCVYIGPSIKGVIRAGAVYRGSQWDAQRAAAAAIEKYPLIKTLIISGDKLPEERIKVKTPGNALHVNYMKLKKAGD